MTVPPELDLAAGFPHTDRDRWREAVRTVLRRSGAVTEDTPPAEVERLLTHVTYEDVPIAPLYTAEDAVAARPGLAPHVREVVPEGEEGFAAWDVRQRHATADPAAVLADLENGATSLWLTLGDAGIPVAALPEVLRDVQLDLAPVVLDAGAQTREAADAFLALAAGRQVSGNLGADPLGLQARTGVPADLATAAALAARVVSEFPRLRAVTVDATPYHEAGGSDAEELGAALATGVAYLRSLTDAGLSVEQAFGQLEFRFAATADQFMTIAKLRAARRLWDRVAEVCGTSAVQRQHATTSAAMMTRRDPWVNLLRTTVACFAAGVGGADAVTVEPFDARLGLPDDFARRIARNTQTLLLEESSLARVVDPSGGSWYVERLSDDLARAAWDLFSSIERSGGMAAALSSGLVASRVAATWERRRADIAHRTAPLTGVSSFPNLSETLPSREPAPPPPSGGLPRISYAQDFEELRDRADAQPSRPTVFLATLGPPASSTARASFAANLFQAGGIATVTGPASSFTGGVACLCASDAQYAEEAASTARTLREAGAIRIWLAGKGSYEGVDGNVFAGCDAVAVLETTLRDLGVGE